MCRSHNGALHRFETPRRHLKQHAVEGQLGKIYGNGAMVCTVVLTDGGCHLLIIERGGRCRGYISVDLLSQAAFVFLFSCACHLRE